MKRMIAISIAWILFFAGCAPDMADVRDGGPKKMRIEIRSMQDDLLSTIDDQDTILDLLDHTDWSEVDRLPGDLVPEKELLVYQEETLLAGQDPDGERGYELIETVTLFQDRPYVMEAVSGDVVKNMVIPKGLLSFYFELPDSAVEKIRSLLDP